MDISPLPHKAPFAVSIELQLQSPSPEATPSETVSTYVPPPQSDSPFEPSRLQLPNESVFELRHRLGCG